MRIIYDITVLMERPGTSDIFAIVSTVALFGGTIAFARNESFHTGVTDAVHSVFGEEAPTDKNTISVNISAGAADMPCDAGQIIYGVETTENEVAVTIDDGPSSSTTIQNLEVAKKHGAHLTFFAIAERLETPESTAIANQIIAEGHEIAVHSFSHTLGKPDINAAEHSAANNVFLQNLGFVPYANRAPGLGYSDSYLQQVANAGQCFIDVSIGSDTKDWQCDLVADPSRAKIGIENRAAKVSLSAGSIVLMHDQYTDNHDRPRVNSPYELDLLLTRIEQEGNRAVTVSQLLQDGTPILQTIPDNSQSEC